MIQTKVGHWNLEKIGHNSELSAKLRALNQEMNDEPGKCITEIKSADLKLKVGSNLSEAKGNKKIIILEDTNGLEQSKRIENCSEKLDSNLTSTNEARILPPNVDVNKQIKFVGLNA